jgi:hypothetical protein
MFKRDFTFKQYTKLCKAALNSSYTSLALSEYIEQKAKYTNKHIVLFRHDIDNKIDIPYALKMAKLEKDMGIKASYYFRIVKDVFNKDAIKTIASYGHEIGYHYEVLQQTKGNIKHALVLFEQNLNAFRKVTPIKTICQHGGSLGENTASTFSGLLKSLFKFCRGKIVLKAYKSNEIWKYKKLKDFDLLGEAYLSLDFNKILYLSDTALKWDAFKYRILDKVDNNTSFNSFTYPKKTKDVINLIEEKKILQLNILVHPANWINPFFPWLKWQILQKFRNFGKSIFLK